ncbi:partial NADH-quinone oxidoreductase subunit J, partial [Anaerolineae bacterium]
VVLNRNLFHSALWLIVSLFGVAGLFVMLSAPFLAAVQVLVYIGAIVILIIFAIMLTRRMMGISEAPNSQWTLGLAAAALTFLVIASTLVLASNGDNPLIGREPLTQIGGESLRDLGVALVDLNQYVLPFLLASVLLEAAMIGAIVLARGEE